MDLVRPRLTLFFGAHFVQKWVRLLEGSLFVSTVKVQFTKVRRGQRAEPPRGVPGRWAGGVTLASQGRERERAGPRGGVSGRGAGGVTLASPGSASSSGEAVGQGPGRARGGPVHEGKRTFFPLFPSPTELKIELCLETSAMFTKMSSSSAVA